MKKIFYYLPIIALFLCWAACDDKEEVPKATLKVAPSGVYMPQEGGSQIVAVITNQTKVLARGYDESWCRVNIEGKKMTIDVQPNDARWERTTDIVVVAGEEDNLVKKVITVEQEVEALNYRITIPLDFSSGLVQTVMDGDIQVAEICNEYVQQFSEQKRATVVYPMTSEGKADLTKGYIIDNGGTLQWNKDTRKYTYTPGTNASPLSHVYLSGGRFTTSPQTSNEVTTTVIPYTVSDGDENTYRVVKIGLQYWTAENLRTTSYIDGTPITRGDSPEEWTTAQEGLYNWFSDHTVNIETSADLQKLYGAYYNWYVVGSGKLAPQGWRVPTDDPNGEFWGKGGDFYYLMSYLENGQYWATMGAKLKLGKTAAEGNQPDYSVGEWAWYNNEESFKGNNISGFSAVPTGYYYAPESTYYNFSKITMFWSATTLTSNGQNALMRSVRWDTGEIYFGKMAKTNGYAIRLVRE